MRAQWTSEPDDAVQSHAVPRAPLASYVAVSACTLVVAAFLIGVGALIGAHIKTAPYEVKLKDLEQRYQTVSDVAAKANLELRDAKRMLSQAMTR